jgi:hypothetical protein
MSDWHDFVSNDAIPQGKRLLMITQPNPFARRPAMTQGAPPVRFGLRKAQSHRPALKPNPSGSLWHRCLVSRCSSARPAASVVPTSGRISVGRPDLPQKVISALARDKVSGKSAALFGYLCAAAPGEAFGAEHYLAAYRIKRAKEVDIAIRAPDFGQVVEDTHESSGAAVVTSREPFP